MDRNAWLRSGKKSSSESVEGIHKSSLTPGDQTPRRKRKFLGADAPTGAWLAFVDRDKLLANRRTDVGAQRTIEPVIGELFEHVSSPSAGSRDGKIGVNMSVGMPSE